MLAHSVGNHVRIRIENVAMAVAVVLAGEEVQRIDAVVDDDGDQHVDQREWRELVEGPPQGLLVHAQSACSRDMIDLPSSCEEASEPRCDLFSEQSVAGGCGAVVGLQVLNRARLLPGVGVLLAATEGEGSSLVARNAEPHVMSTAPDQNPAIKGVNVSASEPRFLWAEGIYWRVREVPAPTFDRRGGTHLVFESDDVMRRLRQFPPDWKGLSDEDLYQLSFDLRMTE